MGFNTRNMQSCLQKCNKLNKSHLIGQLSNYITSNCATQLPFRYQGNLSFTPLKTKARTLTSSTLRYPKKKSTAFSERYWASPACPSRNSSIKKNTSTGRWQNDTESHKTEPLIQNPCSKATLSTILFTEDGSGSDPSLRGKRQATHRLRHGTPFVDYNYSTLYAP